MPSVSEKQRRFMGVELSRKRAGKQTETGMTEQQLRDFARKRRGKRKKKGNPGKYKTWEDGLRAATS